MRQMSQQFLAQITELLISLVAVLLHKSHTSLAVEPQPLSRQRNLSFTLQSLESLHCWLEFLQLLWYGWQGIDASLSMPFAMP